jgi:hypothetical protein
LGLAVSGRKAELVARLEQVIALQASRALEAHQSDEDCDYDGDENGDDIGPGGNVDGVDSDECEDREDDNEAPLPTVSDESIEGSENEAGIGPVSVNSVCTSAKRLAVAKKGKYQVKPERSRKKSASLKKAQQHDEYESNEGSIDDGDIDGGGGGGDGGVVESERVSAYGSDGDFGALEDSLHSDGEDMHERSVGRQRLRKASARKAPRPASKPVKTHEGASRAAKETPKKKGDFGKMKSAGAKGELGIVKDKPFDEAHSIGDDSGDMSSEESVSTNESRPKIRNEQKKVPVNSAAAPGSAAASKVTQGRLLD